MLQFFQADLLIIHFTVTYCASTNYGLSTEDGEQKRHGYYLQDTV